MGSRSLGRATRERAQFHGDGELVRQGFYGGWLSRHESRVRGRGSMESGERKGERRGKQRKREKHKKEKRGKIFPSLSPSQPSWKKGYQDSCLAGLKEEAQAFHHHGCSLSGPQLSRLIPLTPEPFPAVSKGVLREWREQAGE